MKYTSILGLGYTCSLLCDRVVCYRLFEMQEGDENSDIIEKCSTDASVTGYDHFIWAPKERLQKNTPNFELILIRLYRLTILIKESIMPY